MTQEIMNTADIAFDESDGDEYLDVRDHDDISATETATGENMEFHVQMHGYTMENMEKLIAHTAAFQLLGATNSSKMALEIQKHCAELTTKKIDEHLRGITAEIVDQPVIPSFGKTEAPVTMREYIGLCGREYLSQMVDQQGNISKDGWGRNRQTRAAYLIDQYLDHKFESEIKKATDAVIREIRQAVKESHEQFLEAEKARVREAISKTFSPNP